eukprot:scaffold7242_cov400-Prasinococcus_capsulatus_cf.AAC.24
MVVRRTEGETSSTVARSGAGSWRWPFRALEGPAAPSRWQAGPCHLDGQARPGAAPGGRLGCPRGRATPRSRRRSGAADQASSLAPPAPALALRRPSRLRPPPPPKPPPAPSEVRGGAARGCSVTAVTPTQDLAGLSWLGT